MLERIIDVAAAELGLDPVEMRRRNFLAARRVPVHDRHGHDLRQRRLRPRAHRGAAHRGLRRTARRAGRATGARRSPPARHRGQRVRRGDCGRRRRRVRGRRQSTPTAARPFASGRRRTDRATRTSFAMIVADRLGIPLDRHRLRAVRHRGRAAGGGTGGSRSLQLGGTAVLHASDLVLDQARELAATLLEANARRHRRRRRRPRRRRGRPRTRAHVGRSRPRPHRRRPARRRVRLRAGRRDVPVRRARCRRRGRHRDGSSSRRSVTSRSTTAAAS